jgi:hypothetical protein
MGQLVPKRNERAEHVVEACSTLLQISMKTPLTYNVCQVRKVEVLRNR